MILRSREILTGCLRISAASIALMVLPFAWAQEKPAAEETSSPPREPKAAITSSAETKPKKPKHEGNPALPRLSDGKLRVIPPPPIPSKGGSVAPPAKAEAAKPMEAAPKAEPKSEPEPAEEKAAPKKSTASGPAPQSSVIAEPKPGPAPAKPETATTSKPQPKPKAKPVAATKPAETSPPKKSTAVTRSTPKPKPAPEPSKPTFELPKTGPSAALFGKRDEAMPPNQTSEKDQARKTPQTTKAAPAKAAAQAEASATAKFHAVVTAPEGAFLFRSASGGMISRRLPPGTVVEVFETSGDRYRVRTRDGAKGYLKTADTRKASRAEARRF
ncbi:MAG: hypothetical protein KDL87_05985 [Verrucomicrobiae bacterium]|nr:hypothetical protein [Verrucomicrobiae bacterium]